MKNVINGKNAKLFIDGVEVGGVISTTPPETYASKQNLTGFCHGVVVGNKLRDYQIEKMLEVINNKEADLGRTIITSARCSPSAKHQVLMAMLSEKAKNLGYAFKQISHEKSPWFEHDKFNKGCVAQSIEEFKKLHLCKPELLIKKTHPFEKYKNSDTPNGKRNKKS